ncbi:MAG TPA: transcriptional repressor [Solirubrobacteraceae bacterium]|nr:transcriptional repressor [Solirubrobacteraceae bacterium]
MSVPHLTPAVEAPTAAAAASTLRRRGLRVSAARRSVLAALFGAGRPISAEEIASGGGGLVPPSDLASVYRNLETLEALGLVRHTHLGHGPGRYAPSARHDELATCERCGACAVLPPETAEAVRAAVRAAVGFEPHFHHTPLAGLCPACAAGRAATTTDERTHHVRSR